MRSPHRVQYRFGGQKLSTQFCSPLVLNISFPLVKLAYRPQIIFSGSPAEKADLEVADEILEVNGESLENSNHTDVIAHIHNVSQNTFNS